MALDVPAILQAKGPELIIAQMSSKVTKKLVTVLACALAHKLTIKVCVFVHAGTVDAPQRFPNYIFLLFLYAECI
jgi:hypothetical protein